MSGVNRARDRKRAQRRRLERARMVINAMGVKLQPRAMRQWASMDVQNGARGAFRQWLWRRYN